VSPDRCFQIIKLEKSVRLSAQLIRDHRRPGAHT
jgi:hypothetical protein